MKKFVISAVDDTAGPWVYSAKMLLEQYGAKYAVLYHDTKNNHVSYGDQIFSADLDDLHNYLEKQYA